MLQPFDTGLLFSPALIIFIVTLFFSIRVIPELSLSLLLALLKAGIFFVYFGYYFDGRYTFLDDWSYVNRGEILYYAGATLTNLSTYWDLLLATGSGRHFVYYLYNAYAFHLFGLAYFAPVALNVVLTVLIAWLGARLARKEIGFDKNVYRIFFLFLLLYPDLVAWSSLVNGKDVLVLLMHVLFLYGISFYYRQKIWQAVALLVFSSLVLFFLRFYVPLVFAVAFGMASFLSGKGWRRAIWIVGSMGFLGGIAVLIGIDQIKGAFDELAKHYTNPVYGLLRFSLTPIPFNTEASYAFLNIPALIHWMLFPLAGIGVVMLHRYKTPFSSFFLIYFFSFAVLYAVYGELQGPRHRLQLDYAWAVFQALGALRVMRGSRSMKYFVLNLSRLPPGGYTRLGG